MQCCYCGRDGAFLICFNCGKTFCSAHRLSGQHNCEGPDGTNGQQKFTSIETTPIETRTLAPTSECECKKLQITESTDDKSKCSTKKGIWNTLLRILGFRKQ